METIDNLLNLVFKGLGILTILGTIFSQFTKTKKDDEFFAKLADRLPILGRNPRKK